jgi:hypothetical protein
VFPTLVFAATPPFVVFGAVVVIAFSCPGIDLRHSFAPYVLAGCVAFAMLMVWLVAPIIVLFNRPKFLVPPTSRNEQGAWQEWRRGGATDT